MNRRELLKTLAVVLGTSLSGTAARAVLAGATATNSIKAATLDAEQMASIGQLAELIIPTTDTPGAITAGVPDFIHVIHATWYRPLERERFMVGLKALEAQALARYQRGFAACSAQQQGELLAEAESQSGDPDSVPGQFFITIKELTVFGYYTSEVGSTQELIFNPVPMRYKGDYLFADVGRQWTP
jgi:hypothetical protein